MWLTAVTQKHVQKMSLHAANHVHLTFLHFIVKDWFIHLCWNLVRMLLMYLRLNLMWKIVASYDLCGKIVANFQKTFLKPRNVCKCMLVEVMAYPN